MCLESGESIVRMVESYEGIFAPSDNSNWAVYMAQVFSCEGRLSYLALVSDAVVRAAVVRITTKVVT